MIGTGAISNFDYLFLVYAIRTIFIHFFKLAHIVCIVIIINPIENEENQLNIIGK